MSSMKDLSLDHLFCLFKGEPGTRKSTQALSFPTPQYWFSTDQKMDALIQPARAWNTDLAQIDYDDYGDWTKIQTRLEKFQTDCKYKTLVVDSITSNGDVINLQTKRSKSAAKNAAGEKPFMVGGIPVNTLDDYKAESAAFQELIAQLKEIKRYHKINIILIAHVVGERKKGDENSMTHTSRIIVTGGKVISAKIPAYCSEVYHFNIDQAMNVDKEGDYGLLTVHTGLDFARTSLPLPRKIVFNNEPLYQKYLVPAIAKLKEK